MKVKDIYDWIDNCTCHDPDILHEIKQLLTQKRVVSREEILSVVKRINDEITPGGMTTARMVEIAYEELGIEVVEK